MNDSREVFGSMNYNSITNKLSWKINIFFALKVGFWSHYSASCHMKGLGLWRGGLGLEWSGLSLGLGLRCCGLGLGLGWWGLGLGLGLGWWGRDSITAIHMPYLNVWFFSNPLRPDNRRDPCVLEEKRSSAAVSSSFPWEVIIHDPSNLADGETGNLKKEMWPNVIEWW